MARRSDHEIFAIRELEVGYEQEVRIRFSYYPGTPDSWTDPGDPEEFDVCGVEEPDGKGGWKSVTHYGADRLLDGRTVVDEYADWAMAHLIDEMRHAAWEDRDGHE